VKTWVSRFAFKRVNLNRYIEEEHDHDHDHDALRAELRLTELIPSKFPGHVVGRAPSWSTCTMLAVISSIAARATTHTTQHFLLPLPIISFHYL
jgi:hypothetical protein